MKKKAEKENKNKCLLFESNTEEFFFSDFDYSD